jgi:hypothetical protein
MYDALDADFLILIDGRSPFLEGSKYRVSPDGSLQSVPILVFLWELALSLRRILVEGGPAESVVITSTPYVLRIERRGNDVAFGVSEDTGDALHDLAEKDLLLDELINRFKSTAELVLLSIVGSNPTLADNWSIRGLRQTLSSLDQVSCALFRMLIRRHKANQGVIDKLVELVYSNFRK